MLNFCPTAREHQLLTNRATENATLDGFHSHRWCDPLAKHVSESLWSLLFDDGLANLVSVRFLPFTRSDRIRFERNFFMPRERFFFHSLQQRSRKRTTEKADSSETGFEPATL